MALEQITNITGTGVYLPGDDIDTDRIIPARFLKCLTFDDLGQYNFYDVRFAEDGSEKQHPLNDPRFARATIMLSGSNFGCGSSREHAPQAIYRAGFRAIIAVSFAEIFFGNSVTLGMPCVEASEAQIAEIATAIEQRPDTPIAVDVENERVTFGDKTTKVSIKVTAKNALTGGRWDAIGELLEADQAISKTASTLAYLNR